VGVLGKKSYVVQDTVRQYTCILCQEEETVGSAHPLVLAAYVQVCRGRVHRVEDWRPPALARYSHVRTLLSSEQYRYFLPLAAWIRI
jgi:hypothetical protein